MAPCHATRTVSEQRTSALLRYVSFSKVITSACIFDSDLRDDHDMYDVFRTLAARGRGRKEEGKGKGERRRADRQPPVP